jgi:hypothetical protein
MEPRMKNPAAVIPGPVPDEIWGTIHDHGEFPAISAENSPRSRRA